MPGLTGWLLAMAGIILTSFIFLMVGLYCLFASEPNLRLLYAALGALVTMLSYLALDPLHDLGVPIPRSAHDVIAPMLWILSMVVAMMVYALT